MTVKAAALKDWRSCSGGCGRGVELGSEVFKDLIESMMDVCGEEDPGDRPVVREMGCVVYHGLAWAWSDADARDKEDA